jgi:agmatinase
LVAPRFTGVRTFARLPYVTDPDGVDVAVIGLPFDTAATYRVGARFGPEAIRSASVMLRPYHPLVDVDVFETLSVVDAGDSPVVPGAIEETYRRIEETLAGWHSAGIIPITLGGDHSVLLAELRAAAARHGRLGMVQFDSHGYVWDSYWGLRYTHGTPVRRAMEEGLLEGSRVIQVGMRGPLYSPGDLQMAVDMGFEVISTEQAVALGPEQLGRHMRDRLGDGPAFLSFDGDFVDPAFTPGTGTPEPGGPTSREALAMLRAVGPANLVAADVVEVMPSYDSPGAVTALLAANVAYTVLALIALRRLRPPQPEQPAMAEGAAEPEPVRALPG